MARYSFAYAALAASGATAAQAAGYYQCGGQGWTGATSCVDGFYCKYQNDWYYQCVPGTASGSAAVSSAAVSSAAVSSAAAKSTMVTVVKGSSSVAKASTAKASTKTAAASKTSVVAVAPTSKTSTVVAATSKASAVVSSKAAAVSSASSKASAAASSKASAAATSKTSVAAAATTASTGQTQYAGINIAGFDFGCSTDGSCSGAYTDPGTTGITQMQHFTDDDNLNIFRLPIGWQHLLNNELGGDIDATVGDLYDNLVQGCLATGALCVLDLHNYARWNGGIVGQGGPTDDEFADVWSKLATKYASEDNIVFGLMNEPHDLTMSTWATSCQAAVTAIRAAGATTQMILLPGTDYTSAGTFVANSGPELLTITDSDGSTDKLIFDVHRYLDSDGSGTNAECTTDHIDDSFEPLAEWLKTNSRQALLSETGGGNTASCETDVCAAIAYLNDNSDVYLGYIGWAAGAFDTSYVLSETPTGSTDQALVSMCFSRA